MGSVEIARAIIAARWRMRWSRAKLERWQQRHLVANGCPIETPDEFEIHFAKRNVLGLTRDQARAEAERELAGERGRFSGFSFGLSTGTMGAPGVFLTSARERSRWVGTVLGKLLPLRLLTGAKIALVLKHNNRLYTDIRQTRKLKLAYFEASAPVDLWAPELCAFAPDVLVGPPSVLESIARSDAFARQPLRPRVLLAGAEAMFPQDAGFLERAYAIAPRVIYQAKEGFLAASCAQGGIHLNEDLIAFERVEIGRGRFAPVITDFTRSSQTYRRFRLDDVLLAATAPCTCRQPFAALAAVEGRAHDVLFRAGEPVFPLEVNEALLPSLGDADYRVTQTAPEEFAIAVEGGTSAEHLAALRDLIGPARVTIAEYAPTAPGEKRRRVRRLYDPSNDWLNRFTVSRNLRSG